MNHDVGRAALATGLWRLPEEVVADPLGGVNGAAYDTAQLVVLAADNPGRLPAEVAERAAAVLVDGQNRDGSWGSPWWPRHFRLVPTLAAANALATCRDDAAVGALKSALDFLVLAPEELAASAQPDVMAVEYILPDLLEKLTTRLAGHDEPAFHRYAGDVLPQALAANSTESGKLRDLRAAARNGRALPVHIAHSLELLDHPGPGLEDLVTGLPAGCSAAATAAYAAWSRDRRSTAAEVLREQAERLGGALPVIMAMTTFEVLWVLRLLAQAGTQPPKWFVDRWASWTREKLTSEGVRAGVGLPPDGDDTAVAIFLLQEWGEDVPVEPLLRFVHEGGCASYPGERTTSDTTAAHALEALGLWSDAHPGEADEARRARDLLVSHLLDSQQADGTWTDKWHASPFYATFCCATALGRFGGTGAIEAVRRSHEWVLDHQRPDGSWGIWTGTLDETAFALLTLPPSSGDIRVRRAVARGTEFLSAFADVPPGHPARTPMWQGKELYEPHRIVDAAVLSARCRHHARPGSGAR